MASRHAVWVGATPDRVYEIARRTDLARPRLVRALMWIRVAPARIAALVLGRRLTPPPTSDRGVGSLGFTMIEEAPGKEFVLGLMGRFWTATGGVVRATAEQLRRPPPNGLAQAFWNFRVEPSGSGTELSTETRVRCGDAATTRQFRRYWWLARLGSGLIRRSMLRQIRLAAERSGVSR